MMRVVLIIISVFLMFGCDKGYQPSDKELITDEILMKAATKTRKETGLIPFGTEGRMLDEIKMLGLSFEYRQPVSIEEGRELVIKASEALLQEINSNEPVRHYLDRFPFEPKNIIIRIIIQKPDGSNFGEEQLCAISTNEGILKYDIEDPNSNSLKTIYEETSEEALEKLNHAFDNDAGHRVIRKAV